MKGKHLAILLGLVVVVGGASYVLQKGDQSSWSVSGGGAGGKVLNFPINEVAAVHIKAADKELNLVKKGEEWAVRERADYPASFEQVSSLVRKLWDLKTVQEVKVGPSQMPRLELVEPGKGERAGTLVELKGAEGKTLSALLLGKEHLRKSDMEMGPMGGDGMPAGRYVMPVGSASKVSLVSETLSEVNAKPESWLNKEFIKVDGPKTIAVAGQTEGMHWKLTRENTSANWQLVDAKPEEQLDTGKIGSFSSILSGPNFKDVLTPDAKPEETGLDKPATVTIETFDGFSYTLKVGKVTNDAYPVLISVNANIAKERTPAPDEKPEDKAKLDTEFQAKQKKLEEKLTAEKRFEGRPYLLEKFTIDPLLKERTALLAEKKPDPATTSTEAAPAAPGSVTLPPVSATTPPVSVPPATPAPSTPAESSPSPAPAAPQQPPATTSPAPPAATPPPPVTPAPPVETPAPAPAPANPAAPQVPPTPTPSAEAAVPAPTAPPPAPAELPTSPAPAQPQQPPAATSPATPSVTPPSPTQPTAPAETPTPAPAPASPATPQAPSASPPASSAEVPPPVNPENSSPQPAQ